MQSTKWHWFATLSTCAVLSTSLSAQTPPAQPQSPQPTTPSPSAQQDRAAGNVTAAGCLQRGSAATSTSDSAAAASPGAGTSAGGYVLKNAKVSGDTASSSSASPSPSSEPGTAAPAGATTNRAGRDLRLSAGSGVELDQHIGHQVSVTGRLMGGTSDRSSASSPSSEPGAQGSDARRGAMGQTLMVSSVNMIASTCSPGSN